MNKDMVQKDVNLIFLCSKFSEKGIYILKQIADMDLRCCYESSYLISVFQVAVQRCLSIIVLRANFE